jgi:hypothetical protein
MPKRELTNAQKENKLKFVEKALYNLEIFETSFMPKSLVQATLPHSKVVDKDKKESFIFERKNGNYTLTLIANPHYGLPYGSVPRLILSWLTSQAVRNKNRRIELGNITEFVKRIGLNSAIGGERGSITSVIEQTKRLFNCNISCVCDNGKNDIKIKNFSMIFEAEMWWDIKNSPEKSATSFLFSPLTKLESCLKMIYNENMEGTGHERKNVRKRI